jgi:RNA ligase
MIKWKDHRTNVEKLVQDGYLALKEHPTLPLILLNYTAKTQYDKLWNELTLNARGAVLHKDTWEPVAVPFPKFFNYEEVEQLPQGKFKVYEKMDGSLGIGFWYDNQFHIATRGSFTSEQAVKAKEMIESNTYLMQRMSMGYTYLFEIIYPENRIVVDYGQEEKLVLLAIIDNNTGREVPDFVYELLRHESVHIVHRYRELETADVHTLKQVIENHKEGFVLCYPRGQRIKIKGEEYVRLHKIMTGISNKDILEILEQDDEQALLQLLDRVPDEFMNWIRKVEHDLWVEYNKIVDQAFNDYFDIIDHLPAEHSQKDFALEVMNCEHQALLFQIKKKEWKPAYVWRIIKHNLKYEQIFKTGSPA